MLHSITLSTLGCALLICLALGSVNGFQFKAEHANKVSNTEASNDTLGPSKWSMISPLDPFGLIDVASNGSVYTFITPIFGDTSSSRNVYVTTDGRYKPVAWEVNGDPITNELGGASIVYAPTLKLYVSYILSAKDLDSSDETTIGTSPDAVTWTAVKTVSGVYKALYYLNNTLILASNQFLYTSIDGATWTQYGFPALPPDSDLFPVFEFAYENFVFCGYTSTTGESPSYVYFTQNFESWRLYEFSADQGSAIDIIVTTSGSLVTMLSPSSDAANTSFSFFEYDEGNDSFDLISEIYDNDALLGTYYNIFPRLVTNTAQGTSIALGMYLTNDDFRTFTKIDPTACGLAYRENENQGQYSWVRAVGELYFYFQLPNITTYSQDGKEWIPIVSGIPFNNNLHILDAPGPLYYDNDNWVFVSAAQFPVQDSSTLNYSYTIVTTKDGEDFTFGAQYLGSGLFPSFYSLPSSESNYLAFGPAYGGGFWYGQNANNLQTVDVSALASANDVEISESGVTLAAFGAEDALITWTAYTKNGSYLINTYFTSISEIDDTSSWKDVDQPNVYQSSACNGEYFIYQAHTAARFTTWSLSASSDGETFATVTFPNDSYCDQSAYAFGMSCINGNLFVMCNSEIYTYTDSALDFSIDLEIANANVLSVTVQGVDYYGNDYFVATAYGSEEKGDGSYEYLTRTYWSSNGLAGSWTNGTAPSGPNQWHVNVDSLVANANGTQILALASVSTTTTATNQLFFMSS